MKKILSFLIASVAVLGLVGCSSDLHDMGDAKIVDRVTKIVGAMNYSGGNVFSDMELVDATTSTYSFTYKTEMSSNWGSPKDGVCFKVGYKVEDWDSCWGQAKGGNTILSGGTGSVKCTKQNGENISFSGLTNGTSYKIKAVSGIACVDISIEETETILSPVPYYFDGMYLVGDKFTVGSMTNLWSFGADNLIYGASVSKTTGVVTYTKDIVAKDTTTQMGINDSSWGNKQLGGGISIKVGDELTKLDGTEGNFNVTNLKGNTPYRVTITTTPEKVVSVKVEEICSYTLTFEITGLSEGNAAWINGQFWGSSWPNGWPMTDWDSPMNTTLAANIPEATDTGVATFNDKWNVEGVAKPGETLSWKFKPVATTASTTWDTEGANVLGPEGDLTCEISNIEGGTYKVSIDASKEAVSVTKI